MSKMKYVSVVAFTAALAGCFEPPVDGGGVSQAPGTGTQDPGGGSQTQPPAKTSRLLILDISSSKAPGVFTVYTDVIAAMRANTTFPDYLGSSKELCVTEGDADGVSVDEGKLGDVTYTASIERTGEGTATFVKGNSTQQAVTSFSSLGFSAYEMNVGDPVVTKVMVLSGNFEIPCRN